jgi:hypothetical protein
VRRERVGDVLPSRTRAGSMAISVCARNGQLLDSHSQGSIGERRTVMR